MLKPVIHFLLVLFPLVAFACTTRSYEPEWVVLRPIEKGIYHGVGSCGKTEKPERARELAIQRAVAEICYQVRGKCDYEIVYKEEMEDGSVSVDIQADGRTIHTISGIQVVDEQFYPAADNGYAQDTTYVLIRIPAALLPW
ncbi:MAG: LPP20 family lipoprotein [Planctomycetes bacterium]|nr:LPP20 family lipoprotein [Planctomycetota bacterium]